MKTYKTIFLDLDNTLYAYGPCNAAGLKAVFVFLSKKLYREISEIKSLFSVARLQVHKRLKNTAASHSRFLYFQNLIEILAKKTDLHLSLQAEQIYWNSYFKKMKLYPLALKYLKKVKQAKIQVVVLTDLTAEIQFRKLIRLGIEKYIDWIVSSEEAGIEKPSSKIFKYALKKTNSLPKSTLMIGDSLEKDMAGAKALKMDTFQIVSEQSFERLLGLN